MLDELAPTPIQIFPEEAYNLTWLPDSDPELRAALARLALIVFASGIVVQGLTGEIAAANKEAATILGLTLDELTGRTSKDPRWAATSENGLPLPGEEHPAMVTLATGKPVKGFLMGVKVPNASTGPANPFQTTTRWIEIDSIPLLERGRLLGVVAIFEDITNGPRGISATSNLLEAYRYLAENSSDFTALINAEGYAVWISPSVTNFLGWTPSEIVDTPPGSFVHPEDRLKLIEALSSIDHQGGIPSAEFRMTHKNGGTVWISAMGRFVTPELISIGFRDITSDVYAREALAASEKRYHDSLNAIPYPYIIFTPVKDDTNGITDFQYTYVNTATEKLYGKTKQEIIGHTLLELYPIAKEDGAYDCYCRTCTTGQTCRIRIRELHRNNNEFSYDVSATPFENEIIVVAVDVTAEVKAETELRHLATHDTLTGVLNRRQGLQEIDDITSRRKNDSTNIAIAYLDIDDFKTINDTYSHATGDEFLTVAAQRFRDNTRPEDIIVRMGGDEFLIVLNSIRDLTEASLIIEKVRRTMRQPVALAAGNLTRTISAGITLHRENETLEETINRADQALYRAKNNGRNQTITLE